MEKYQTIDEYIAAVMGDEITRKAKSPLLGLLILAVGIGMLVLLRTQTMGDALMTACLTVGILALAVGIVMTAMCLTKAVWHYVYKPTRSRMRWRKCYLVGDDYRRCVDAINVADAKTLATLKPDTNSNSSLRILYSRDHAVALLQAGRDDSGHFEPETPVLRLSGSEVTWIETLCK